MFAAVDGGQRLWDREGLWKGPASRSAYRWRRRCGSPAGRWSSPRPAGRAARCSRRSACSPASSACCCGWSRSPARPRRSPPRTGARSTRCLRPTALPTIMPRFVVFVPARRLGARSPWASASARGARRRDAARQARCGACSARRSRRARARSLDRGAVESRFAARPRSRRHPGQDLGRRYIELLAENLGQPGFRELLLVAHDMDARRDVRVRLARRRPPAALLRPRAGRTAAAQAEAFDLAGRRARSRDGRARRRTWRCRSRPTRTCCGFPPKARGAARRTGCAIARGAGARARRSGGRRRRAGDPAVGGAAAGAPARAQRRPRRFARPRRGTARRVRSRRPARRRCDAPPGRFTGLFVIRPAHNPLGPLDFAGVYDERSDRHFSLARAASIAATRTPTTSSSSLSSRASGERIVTVQS